MPRQTTIVAGGAGSGKTTYLINAYATQLQTARVGGVLWISPTQRAAADIRRRLGVARCSGILSPGVMTFDQFADRVLESARQPVRPLSPLLKRRVLDQIIQTQLSAGQLSHFGPIARMGGLLDLVADFISDMKRLEIWPEDFQAACRGEDWSAKNRELHAIYARYQAILHSHQLYDPEGRFWTARELLRTGDQRQFRHLELVVVDGFADFTRTQHEILELLGERSPQMCISLPLERSAVDGRGSGTNSPSRTDLFAKPLTTLAALRHHHPHLEMKWVAPPAAATGSLGHLERHLFGDPRGRVSVAADGEVRVIAAGARLSELERIAREIKKLLLGSAEQAPARPEEIVVVFRSLSDPRLVTDVFQRFGLPVSCEQGRPLSECPSLKALLMLLDLDQQDWPFAQVLSVLTNTWLQPNWAEEKRLRTLAAADFMVRHCQVVRGREALLQQLTHRATLPDEAVEDHRIPYQARLALDWFNWLSSRLAVLPTKETPHGWVDKLAGFIRSSRWAELHEQGAAADGPWRIIFEGLNSIGQLDQRLRGEPRQLSRADLGNLLEELGASQQLPREQRESGCVRVLSATSARTLSVPYLFVADLSERSFPAPGGDDRLLSVVEQQRLVSAGLPLPAADEHHRDEMLLFYEVATRATKRLTLSYASLDDKAQPLVPSPFIVEVQATCGPQGLKTLLAADLSPLPPEPVPYSVAEWRLQALSEALAGETTKLAKLCQHPQTNDLGQNLLSSLQATALRRKRDQFGPYDGLLGGRATQQLTEIFAEHVWSASELELYGACPFRFLLQRLLRLEPLPDLVLEIDYGRRGSVTHEVLASFHRHLNEAAAGPSCPDATHQELHIALLRKLLEEQLPVSDDERSVDAAMRLLDREEIRTQLDLYLDAHLRYETHHQFNGLAPQPAHFEVSFGLTKHAGEGISRSDPLEITVEEETVRLSGRIDRIDVVEHQGNVLFSLIDYKNTAPALKLETCLEKNHLQLPLYAIAVEQLLLAEERAQAWQIGYWQTRLKDSKHGYRPGGLLATIEEGDLQPTDSWKSLKVALLQRIVQYQRAVRRGDFPVYNTDDKCTSTCPYKTVCRIGTIRSLEKHWEHEV